MRVLFTIFIFLSVAANAQRPFSRDFWLNETQTPVSVNCMAEAPSGYIWLGTDDGLYRFNGREFYQLNDSSRQAVTAVACVGKDVYVGYAGGALGKANGNAVSRMKSVNEGPHTTIRDIHSDGKGILWLATEEGVYMFSQGRYYKINSSKGLADDFTYCLSSLGSSMLVGTDNGISQLSMQGGKLSARRYGTQQGLPDNIVNVVRATNNGSCVWAGTHEGGFAKLSFDRGSIARAIRYGHEWVWGQVTDIVPLSDREAWASTETGYLVHVVINDTVKVEPFRFEGKRIRKLLYVRSGNILCATDAGLTVVTVSHASYVIAKAPYLFSTLTAVTCEGNKRLWAGQQNELMAMPLGMDTITPKCLAALPAAITCLQVQDSNTIWIGTFGGGLWCYRNKQLREVTNIESLDKGNILSVAMYKGHLWVASLNGVDELEIAGDNVSLAKHHNKASGIGSDYVYDLYNDGTGRLWLGTDGAGAAMYDGNRFRRWDSSEGMRAKVVYTIAADAQGQVWAGTPDKGLLRYDGKKWKQLTAENGLQDMNISSVIANATGQVVAVSQKGIDEWFPGSDLFRRFNTGANLEIEHISTVLNCVARDSAGNVYVPCDKGLIVFTNVANPVNLRPAISLNTVSVFFRPVAENTTEFNYDENQLSFNFEGINYSNIERLYYRYKLEGYHDNWIPTSDETVTLSQLPAGKFNFRIQASLDRDFEEANEANYSFEIKSPFWRSAWFLVLCTVLGFAILYVYIKLRERGLKKVSRLQAERMRFEYEHLKSQVNPHFLFNSLNTLSALIEEDKDRAVDYTGQLSDLYRSMLSHKDMDLISLADELAIIENYMYIQQTRFGNALRLELDIPGDIIKRARIVPLALQILVENAIKHNVVSRSAPLVIYIEADNDKIKVRNRLQPKMSKERGEGLGLPNIQSRYALLTKKHIQYGISDDQFIVTLPLL